MPIYEYQCRECSHRLEKLQKMSDAPLKQCPECGRDALSKLVSAAGFRLKGGGWYETDFKKDGKRNLAGDEGSSKSSNGDSGGKDSGKGNEKGGTAGSGDGAKKESAKSTDGSGKAGSSSSGTASNTT